MIIIFLFVLGICLGSFGKVIVDNEDNPKHIILGKSKCDSCGHSLGFGDLVPVVSWVVNKGKCRYCSQNISIIYPIIEIICGLLFLGLGMIWDPVNYWIIYILGWSMVMIIYSDIKSQTISLVFLGLMILGGFAAGASWLFVIISMIGMVTIYILSIIVNKIKIGEREEGMGIGDILLVGGIGMYYIYMRDIWTNIGWQYNSGIISQFVEGFGSQNISYIYIFLIRLVISSIYGLFMAIIYIYSSQNKDKNNQIAFAPALILGFLTILFL